MKKCFCVFLWLLAGCTVGPQYKPPENTVTDEWSSIGGAAVSTDELLVDWWKIFKDPILDSYMEQAALHNNDILSAEANILQARAMRKIKASSFYPHIDADVNGTKTYFSKNGPIFYETVQGVSSPTTGLPFGVEIPQIQNLFNALFDASWEIDLFGKTRRHVEAAQALIESAIAQRDDTLISIMAEIARNYIEVRSFQRKEELVKENITILKKKASIIKKQLEAGYVNQLDKEKIQAMLADEEALLPDIEAEIYRGIYLLSILIGRPPEALIEELSPHQSLPNIPKMIGIGVRSELLRRRPDIRQSERQLAAATANIGVAIASFFPSLTLLGDGGFQSLKIGNLFTSMSKTGALGGDLTLPIFRGGHLFGNLRSSQSAAYMATYQYQQTVLKALQEAESALIGYREAIKTASHYQTARYRNQNLVMLSEERYEKGVSPLMEVLDRERELLLSEQTLLNSDTMTLINLITLYKTLGGGWEVSSELD